MIYIKASTIGWIILGFIFYIGILCPFIGWVWNVYVKGRDRKLDGLDSWFFGNARLPSGTPLLIGMLITIVIGLFVVSIFLITGVIGK